jgi:hypothetical protein
MKNEIVTLLITLRKMQKTIEYLTHVEGVCNIHHNLEIIFIQQKVYI